MIENNLAMLDDTLSILKKGYYITNDNKRVDLKLDKARKEQCSVFLPDDVDRICSSNELEKVLVLGRCGYDCINDDSYSVAMRRYKECSYMFGEGSKPILVLNFANPVNPGGGVRRGANAQEEDLCRKSSLLLSLESRTARAYYDYNYSLNTYLGSDAIIITPEVEIIKDCDGRLLDETAIVAVMTCAAPMITYGLEGKTQEEYEALLLKRINGMLKCAAYLGYTNLVLGAWGCGAFRNDAKLVSDLFYKALKELDYCGMREKDLFRSIDFALLCRRDTYNYDEFYRNFGHFYRDEDAAAEAHVKEEIKKTEVNLDKIRGCLLGGAAGDALGYPVEFMDESSIFSQYGPNGITEYRLDRYTGKALISDDTQMTMFTACGMLVRHKGKHAGHCRNAECIRGTGISGLA